MIKTRLLKLLKGSGKYIGANIFWQWIALLFPDCGSVVSGKYDSAAILKKHWIRR